MKKFVTVLLALTLVLSLAIPALAETPTGTAAGADVSQDWSDANAENTISFQVSYMDRTKQDLVPEGGFPKEELKFQVQKDGTLPADVSISVAAHTMKSRQDLVTVTIPRYTVPGKYNYTIQQTPGKTLGVVYDTTPIKVQVVVKNNTPEKIAQGEPPLLKFVSFTAKSDGKKVNGLVNTYTVTDGDDTVLSVTKKVAGNMGAKTQQFDATVTLTKGEEDVILSDVTVNRDTYTPKDWRNNQLQIPIKIKHDDPAVHINGVPAGVKAAVKEDSKHTNPAEDINNPSQGYTATYKVNGTPTETQGSVAPSGLAITAGGKQAVEITNTKNNDGGVRPDTGVYLDAMPYIILLAVAVIGLMIFLVKRRANREY